MAAFKHRLRNIAVAVVKTALSLPGGWFRSRASTILYEALETADSHQLAETFKTVSTAGGDIKFYCLGNSVVWRVDSFFSKEPETIEWIDSFDDGDVFWGIGANIGVYSMYAAVSRKVRVLSFEPSSANYFMLNRNIEVNNLDDLVCAYCMAFENRDVISVLHMRDTDLGAALSSFDDPTDESGKQFDAVFKQGSVGFSIDSFIRTFTPPFPNRIKIDVDGAEDRIIAGAQQTLCDDRLKSISIELNSRRQQPTNKVVSLVEGAGLKLTAKRHSEMFEAGPYKDLYNYQFTRP